MGFEFNHNTPTQQLCEINLYIKKDVCLYVGGYVCSFYTPKPINGIERLNFLGWYLRMVPVKLCEDGPKNTGHGSKKSNIIIFGKRIYCWHKKSALFNQMNTTMITVWTNWDLIKGNDYHLILLHIFWSYGKSNTWHKRKKVLSLTLVKRSASLGTSSVVLYYIKITY